METHKSGWPGDWPGRPKVNGHYYTGRMNGTYCTTLVEVEEGLGDSCGKLWNDPVHKRELPEEKVNERKVQLVTLLVFQSWVTGQIVEQVQTNVGHPRRGEMVILSDGKTYKVGDIFHNYPMGAVIIEVDLEK